MEKEFRGPVLVTEDISNSHPCICKYISPKKKWDITVASPRLCVIPAVTQEA